jgi:dihydropteroate synthase
MNFIKNCPQIMGIVNVTPDSFSDGGRFQNHDGVLTYIEQLISQGASIIDIGAQSTRPGASLLSAEEEITRLSLILPELKKRFKCKVSLDTFYSDVALFGLDHGVDIINDVSGLSYDTAMIDVCARYNATVVIMHMKGLPKTMQDNPNYEDVFQSVFSFFETQVKAGQQGGISSFILDPGIGFGKSLDHNITLLKRLSEFKQLGWPMLVGTSRKSFIDQISHSDIHQRLGGTIASNLMAWRHGATFFRVHDVFDMKQAFDVSLRLEGVPC